MQNNVASKRQKKLFHDKNIWVSVLIVSAPAFILGFMSGLFAFCDQLMMVKFIPEFMNVDQIWQNGHWDAYDKLVQGCSDDQLKLIMHFATPKDAIASLIRTSVAYSAPITVLINAAALLLGNGTAINYSKYSGAKNLPMAERTWTQGFWANMILSIMITAIICGGCQIFISFEQGAGLTDSLNNIKNSELFNKPGEMETITNFYNDYYAQTRIFAAQYIYIMGGACILCLYSQFITYLVIAEGRQTVVVVAAIFCNGLNILLDFVLIKYGKLAMIGGAVATDIGWLINTGICFTYVYFLQRHNDTNLNLSSLKKINFHFKEYGFLFALGLPSFVRNLSMAIAATIQMSLIVSVITNADGIASTYQNIYGAVNAIYNLSFTALFGIINGSRIICSYNYGAGNFKRVRWSYLVNVVYALVYGSMMYFVICYGASTWLLGLFDITKNEPELFGHAQYMLQISMLQIPVMAIGIGGMTLFQATGKWWQASIAGIMQGIVCCLPISFLMQWICIKYTNIDLFLWVPFIIASVATLINLIWSLIYIKLRFQDKHVPKIATNKH